MDIQNDRFKITNWNCKKSTSLRATIYSLILVVTDYKPKIEIQKFKITNLKW